MTDIKMHTDHWLKLITGTEKIPVAQNVFMANPNMKMLQVNADSIQNPSRAEAVGDYKAKANAAATPGTAPISVFDGMQTAVNLCRTKSQFNPLDPENFGNKAHFLLFTQFISSMPFVTLQWAETTDIKQQSRNSDALINSFVGGFKGMVDEDKNEIINSVKSLVSAALSYSNQTEKQSNFSQNLLQVDGEGNVQFNLYSSTFEISSSSHKGNITFHSEYSLAQVSYTLSPATWAQVKSSFAEQLKVTVDDWLNNMKTPVMPGSSVRAICLEDKKPVEA
ncbi:MAG: hypothetical protein ACI808_001797 [Paraglaciecola sp.]|jgi:hypothetical protein